MVNSKKMSKSSVAVIVLSILLVLSMVLGLTGAWYTANDDYAGGSAGSDLEFRDAWLTVGLANDGQSSIYATRANGDDAEVDDVMPGDFVYITGEKLTATITLDEGADEALEAWVFIVDESNAKVAGSKIGKTGKVEYSIPVADLANEYLEATGETNKYKVKELLHQDDVAGAKVVTNITLGAYTAYAIQAENLATEDAAWTALQAQLAA